LLLCDDTEADEDEVNKRSMQLLRLGRRRSDDNDVVDELADVVPDDRLPDQMRPRYI